jgi:hypothetical protein
MNTAVQSRIAKLFRNAHALAKNCRPYTDFHWMCKLDNAKGVDIGQTYHNDKAAAKFVEYIAKQARSTTAKLIQEGSFLSLISDGSTDTSWQEAEILYARISCKGQVITRFIGIRNLEKADANSITMAVNSMMSETCEHWQNKFVGYAADGAAVMQGKLTGVVTRMREQNCSEMVAVHCTAHRVELAYKDAVKEIALYKRVNLAMLGMYLFYRNSPLNRANLKRSFETVNAPFLVPTRVGGTRWVPHTNRAISHILTGYIPIVQHLEQVTFCNKNTLKVVN